MFIQVIQGHVTDRDEVKEAMDRWVRDLAPGSIGWLGSTGGITDDDTFVTLARFESREAARRNSHRHEQEQWWTELSKTFSGEVTFHDCAETGDWLGGGSDDAGFVQIMHSRVRDLAGLRAWMDRQDYGMLRTFRPDIIGGLWAAHGDGGLTEAVYFTSEAEARAGEGKEAPAEMRAAMEEMRQFYEGDFTYLDLKDPWLASPR
ncbi:hypothetical protein [Actinomadura roseirufa]|uniref:hypothetical protein n=1 Tax=Actinomadura roseirufa TaxID=2094049 RepID=UPI001041B6FC|nr:hypothetical protein [Actinomadura roseirufa]